MSGSAVQRPARCSAEPGPIGWLQLSWTPDQRVEDARERADALRSIRATLTSVSADRRAIQIFGAIQFAINRPAVDDSAVTKVPQDTSTITTRQVQCLSSDSEVSSKVA